MSFIDEYLLQLLIDEHLIYYISVQYHYKTLLKRDNTPSARISFHIITSYGKNVLGNLCCGRVEDRHRGDRILTEKRDREFAKNVPLNITCGTSERPHIRGICHPPLGSSPKMIPSSHFSPVPIKKIGTLKTVVAQWNTGFLPNSPIFLRVIYILMSYIFHWIRNIQKQAI